MITETQKAYVAGIVDGEGNISLNYSKRGLRPRIGITNTDLAILYFIQGFYGGRLCWHNSKKEIGKISYRLEFEYGMKVKKLLQDITPILRIKKPQAQLLLLYLKLFGSSRNSSPLKNEIKQQFVSIFKTLNSRGFNEKRDKLLGNLKDEIISSQVVKEILRKVQRLPNETKELKEIQIIQMIKNHQGIYYSQIVWGGSYRLNDQRKAILDNLISSGQITMNKNRKLYVGNLGMNIPPQKEDEIVRTSGRPEEVRDKKL